MFFFCLKDTAEPHCANHPGLSFEFLLPSGTQRFKNYKQLCMPPIVVMIESQHIFPSQYIIIAFDTER